jgi:hypothetical protein
MMKKALLTGIAALLVTSCQAPLRTAHADDENFRAWEEYCLKGAKLPNRPLEAWQRAPQGPLTEEQNFTLWNQCCTHSTKVADFLVCVGKYVLEKP